MRTCISCGAAAKTGEKFCGQCGSPLGPELPGEKAGQSVPLVPIPSLRKNIMIIGAVLVILIIAVAAGYIFLKGPASTAPSTANKSGSAGSYVIVETEVPVTSVPTNLPLTATTPPTEIPTTVKTPKYGICPADRKFCSNNCTDIRTDNKNCGTCGNICPTGHSCTNGNCMQSCPSVKTACPEGCFNLNTDADHCGTCGNNCPSGLVCSNGQCAPPPTTIITAI